MTDNSPPGTNSQQGSGRPGKRPSLRAVFTNMKVRMPLHRKLYLVLRNNWIKIRTRQNCCGHLGQPGC
jgi:hypothetical protein